LCCGELGGNGVELFGHRRKRVELRAQKLDEDGFAVRQVIELPVVWGGVLFWGEA